MDLHSQAGPLSRPMQLTAVEYAVALSETSENPAIDKLLSALTKVIKWLQENGPAIKELIKFFSGLFGA